MRKILGEEVILRYKRKLQYKKTFTSWILKHLLGGSQIHYIAFPMKIVS